MNEIMNGISLTLMAIGRRSNAESSKNEKQRNNTNVNSPLEYKPIKENGLPSERHDVKPAAGRNLNYPSTENTKNNNNGLVSNVIVVEAAVNKENAADKMKEVIKTIPEIKKDIQESKNEGIEDKPLPRKEEKAKDEDDKKEKANVKDKGGNKEIFKEAPKAKEKDKDDNNPDAVKRGTLPRNESISSSSNIHLGPKEEEIPKWKVIF
jgi:hypothetical protein